MKKSSFIRTHRISAIIITVLAAVLVLRIGFLLYPKKTSKADTSAGLDYISGLESRDANETEVAIRNTREQFENDQPSSEGDQQPENTDEDSVPESEPDRTNYSEKQLEILNAIEEGDLDYALRDFLIVGDSLVKGMEEYGVLDSSQVIAKVGARTSFIADNMDSIISSNPRYLILHFGENEVDSKERASVFADSYKERIKELMEALPDTEIYVDSIFPVEEKALGPEPYLVDIDYYNTYIDELTTELGVNYIDYTPLFASFERNYYDGDGIHPIKDFFTEQYLPIILKEVYDIE